MTMVSSVAHLRELFPALKQQSNNRPLIYFDNGATAQKPQSVISLINEMNSGINANIHRAVYELSFKCTSLYEAGREAMKALINAKNPEEVIFTSGTTASINLVANSFTNSFITKGDSVLICEADHHSNIVPWQMACRRVGANLRVLPVDDNGEWRVDLLDTLLDESVKIVSVAHISNVLGVENPVEFLIKRSHEVGAKVLIDGAQGIVHGKVDVQQLDCDFYTFSAHKLYGPTGMGVLYGKKELLESMDPWMGGGDMVNTVSLQETTYAPLPLKFEAGTPNFIAAAALSEVACFLSEIEPDFLHIHEQELIAALKRGFESIDGVTLYGISNNKLPIFSFNIEGIHHADLAMLLDKMGVAVRSGMMCCEPLMTRFGVTGMVRASLLPYNTVEEVESFFTLLKRSINILR